MDGSLTRNTGMHITGGGARDMKIEAVLKELHAVK